MDTFVEVICSWFLFVCITFLAFIEQTDVKVCCKYRNKLRQRGMKNGDVKSSSLLRKLPIPQSEFAPLMYVKVIPLLIDCVILLIVTIICLLYFVFSEPSSWIVFSKGYRCFTIGFIMTNMFYYGLLQSF